MYIIMGYSFSEKKKPKNLQLLVPEKCHLVSALLTDLNTQQS